MSRFLAYMLSIFCLFQRSWLKSQSSRHLHWCIL